jgi:hypothetical protein
MLFGEMTEFAIECEVVDQVEPFIYCRFRFWLAGRPIGDYLHENVLGTLVFCAQSFLRYRGQRRLPSNVPGETEFERLTALTQSDNPVTMQMALRMGARSRFALHEVADDAVGSMADLYVIDGEGEQMILAKAPRSSDEVVMTAVPAGRVDAILDGFVQWSGDIRVQGFEGSGSGL